MYLKLISILMFIFSLFNLNSNLSCEDFKNGSFHVKEPNGTEIYYTLERDEFSQIETNMFGDKVYYTIKWINDCSYLQKFDKTKMKLTDEMKMVNRDGGMIIELLEVKNDSTIRFQSYVKKFKDLSFVKGEFSKFD